MNDLDILALGTITIDILLGVNSYPHLGSEASGKTLHLRVGGSSTNTAVAGAMLGLRTGVAATVGRDHLGEIAAEELAMCGVDTTALRRQDGVSTSVSAIIVTPDDHRTMFSYLGASRCLGPADLPIACIHNARALHLTGYALLNEPRRAAIRRAIELANEARVPISLDPGVETCRRAADLVRSILPSMTFVLLDREEASFLVNTKDPKEIVTALQAQGVAWVGVKLGADGCWLAGPDGVDHNLPSFSVTVRDTTGAGDAFNAGVLFAYLNQLSPKAMTIMGNAMGALACTVWGIGRALPGQDALRELLEQAMNAPQWTPWRATLEEALNALATSGVPSDSLI